MSKAPKVTPNPSIIVLNKYWTYKVNHNQQRAETLEEIAFIKNYFENVIKFMEKLEREKKEEKKEESPFEKLMGNLTEY